MCKVADEVSQRAKSCSTAMMSCDVRVHGFKSGPRQLKFFFYENHWLLWVHAFALHYPSCILYVYIYYNYIVYI